MSDDVAQPQSTSLINIQQVEHGLRMYAAAFTAAAQALGKGLHSAATKTKEFASSMKDHLPKPFARAQVDPPSVPQKPRSQEKAEDMAKVKEQPSLSPLDFDKETQAKIANAGQQFIIVQSQASVMSDSAQAQEQNAQGRDSSLRQPSLDEIAAMGLSKGNETFRQVNGLKSWQLPSVSAGSHQRGGR